MISIIIKIKYFKILFFKFSWLKKQIARNDILPENKLLPFTPGNRANNSPCLTGGKDVQGRLKPKANSRLDVTSAINIRYANIFKVFI